MRLKPAVTHRESKDMRELMIQNGKQVINLRPRALPTWNKSDNQDAKILSIARSLPCAGLLQQIDYTSMTVGGRQRHWGSAFIVLNAEVGAFACKNLY